jgi:hypothetical protein
MDRIVCRAHRACVVSVVVALVFSLAGATVLFVALGGPAIAQTASAIKFVASPGDSAGWVKGVDYPRGWGIRPSGGGYLAGVSCPSPTACVAVGMNSAQTTTLAKRWDGSRWSTQAMSDIGRLTGVSCTSGTACVAVGYRDATGPPPFSQRTVAERWNGTRWMIQKPPSPVGESQLNGVSCASSTSCVAVGSVGSDPPGSEQTLVERWNGQRWTIQTTRTPGFLSAVSCISIGFCIAVGWEVAPGATYRSPLTERWNGRDWTVQTMPPTVGGIPLTAVSCTSSAACTAVGSYDAGGTLAERWNGQRWTIESMPQLARGSLYGVSCASNRVCTAVGQDRYATLAERWNGRHWAIQTTPSPPALVYYNGSGLSGVSCLSPSVCTAVGSWVNRAQNPRSLVERWIRPKTAGPGPLELHGSLTRIPGTVRLTGVACPPAGSCVAVGSSAPPIPSIGAVVVNGHVIQVPGIVLTSVACPRENFCLAVGYGGGGKLVPIVDGKPGTPTTFNTPYPVAIGCGSPDSCWITGDWGGYGGARLVHVVNGKVVRTMTFRHLFFTTPSDDGAVGAPACWSANSCIIVGTSSPGLPTSLRPPLPADGQGLVFSLANGKLKTVGRVPAAAALSGLACTSPSFCTIVGYGRGTDIVLTMRNDRLGPVRRLPRTGSRSGFLSSVLLACRSADSCYAFGPSWAFNYALGRKWEFTRIVSISRGKPGRARDITP